MMSILMAAGGFKDRAVSQRRQGEQFGTSTGRGPRTILNAPPRIGRDGRAHDHQNLLLCPNDYQFD
jgi:hypothetical protein